MKGGGLVLTAKREKFVRGLVAGLSQRQAYYEAYPNSKKWKPETVDNKASKLFKENEILARYNELMEEHKNKALWTREEAVNELIWLKETAKEDIIKKGYRQANSTSFINAIKELNALNDTYPDKKQVIEMSGKMSVSNPYEELSADELRELISLAEE